MPVVLRLPTASARWVSVFVLYVMLLGALLAGCGSAPQAPTPPASRILLATVGPDFAGPTQTTTGLAAYNADTGALLWQTTPAPDATSQSVALTAASKNTVYFAERETILAYNAQTGQQRWDAEVPSYYETHAIAATPAGVLVVEQAISGSTSPSVIVELYSAADGKRQWTFPLKQPQLAGIRLVVGGDTAYLMANAEPVSYPPDLGYAVFAINLAAGALRWQLPFADDMLVDYGVADQAGLYLSAEPAYIDKQRPSLIPVTLTAYNAADGQPRWHVQESIGATSAYTQSPIIVGGVLYVLQSVTQHTDMAYNVLALDAATGQQIQAWPAPSNLLYIPHMAVANDSVYLGTAENPHDPPTGGLGVLALKLADGRQRWNVSINQPGPSSSGARQVYQDLSTLATTGGVYVVLNGFPTNQIESLDPDTGQQRWTVQVQGDLGETGRGSVLLIGG